MTRPTLLLPLLAFAASAVVACSADDDDRCTFGVDCPPCEGTLAEAGATCPAMFDGTAQQLPACTAGRPALYDAFVCGDSFELMTTIGFFNEKCFYDASSQQLVSATTLGDTLSYCEGTSFVISSGRIMFTGMCEGPTATNDCRSQP